MEHRLAIVFQPHFPGLFARGAGHQLHQPARPSVADGVHGKLAFLARDRVNEGPIRTLWDRDQRKAGLAVIAVPINVRGLTQNHPQIAAAQFLRQTCHQHVIGFGFGLFSQFLEELHPRPPIAFARHFAHRFGQRAIVERGALGRSGRDIGCGRRGQQRLPQPLQRQHPVEVVGILRGHFKVTVGLSRIAALGRGAPGPVEPL